MNCFAKDKLLGLAYKYVILDFNDEWNDSMMALSAGVPLRDMLLITPFL